METVNPTTDAAKRLAELLRPVEADLAEVNRRLQAELRHDDPAIDQLAQHSFRMGGKRLRPALLLLTARAVGEVNDSHRVLAAVVEMIHTATLVHDDVLDEADVRRHEPTANARWGNHASVLLGDYLFTHAFYLASTLETTFGCRTVGRSTNIVCEGELLQDRTSGNFDLSQEDYYRIIDAKTAELCACCCLLGAHYAGASGALAAELELFGRELGLAFQIADDLLDLEGEERLAGKSLGTDLAHRKMTLPLIYLRDQLSGRELAELRRLFETNTPERFPELLDWLNRSGALEHTRQTALSHARSAELILRGLADSPSRRSLAAIAEFSALRDR